MDKTEALQWLKHVKDPEVSPGVIVERYSETSKQYDQIMAALDYNGASETAMMLTRLFPAGREEVEILDIAAGTGLCAVEFHKQGFRRMTALEPSLEMLRKAERRDLYNKYINDGLDTYDAATMSSFCVDIMRKLPLKSLEEIVRVVKPGGYVVNTGHQSTFEDGEEWTAEFRRKLRLLETRGQWRRVELWWFPNYLADKDGVVSVHQVC